MNVSGSDDEVDAILAGWRRVRPDLDPSPLAVFSRLLRLSWHMDKFRKETLSVHGLEPWEFEMLTLLRREGEPYELAPSAFMAELLVPSGTLTHRINLMVERGYAVRHQDETDRRVKYVKATPLGIQRADEAMVDLLGHEAEMTSDLAEADRTELARLLKVLLSRFDSATSPEELT